uniref:Uncharacterized protein n=1 Tax=Avena sativa TaxID=4498 RepID=A0ACD5VSR1_AVESA
MASVASRLSRAARLATAPRSLAPRRPRHDINGDTTFTIWTRPLFVCAASPLGPRFLRRGLANLPAGEDSTGLSVGAEPEDLEDEDDPYFARDPATIFNYDEKDLASEESMWALYERWCVFFQVSRDHDEMRRRFDRFKTTARDIHEFNKSGATYTKGLNNRSDRFHHEFSYRRVRLPPMSERLGRQTQVFCNEKGEITPALLTNGVLKEIDPPAPRIVKPVKMIKSTET